MMGRGVYFLLVICLVLSLQVQAFHVRPLLQTRINLSKSLLSSLASNVESVFTNPPDEEKSRLRLVLSGDNVCSALFRSDLTRTVVFGRGCAVMFKETKKTEAEVIVEGRRIEFFISTTFQMFPCMFSLADATFSLTSFAI